MRKLVFFSVFFVFLAIFQLNFVSGTAAAPQVGICIDRVDDGAGGWYCSNPRSTLKPNPEFWISGNYSEADYWLIAISGEEVFYFDLATMRWQPGFQATFSGPGIDFSWLALPAAGLPLIDYMADPSIGPDVKIQHPDIGKTVDIYFGVDAIPDGVLNGESLVYATTTLILEDSIIKSYCHGQCWPGPFGYGQDIRVRIGDLRYFPYSQDGWPDNALPPALSWSAIASTEGLVLGPYDFHIHYMTDMWYGNKLSETEWQFPQGNLIQQAELKIGVSVKENGYVVENYSGPVDVSGSVFSFNGEKWIWDWLYRETVLFLP